MAGTAAALRGFAEAIEVRVEDWQKPLEERVLGDWQSCMMMGVIYLLSLSLVKSQAYGKAGPLVKFVSTVNNWVMCAYSLYTFVGVAALMVANWMDAGYPMLEAVCDKEHKMMRGMDYWMFHFYLSKFWEWIDTWILLLKGKPVWPPSNSQFFLHVFHHCTTASIVWVGVNGELPMGYLAALTNSFVHIPMYLYYGVTEFWQGARHFGVFITPIQIIQFIMVICAMVPSMISPSACGATRRAVMWWGFTYAVFLTLFVQMFLQKKNSRRSGAKGGKEASAVAAKEPVKEQLSEGVEFPGPADEATGKRSSMAVNQETFAVAVGAVDAERAKAVRDEKGWRMKYQRHVCENVRASMTEPEAARKVARAGLDHLHSVFRFVRDGVETSLSEAMTKYTKPLFETREIRGTAPRKARYGVDYKQFGTKGALKELQGAELRVQADKWVQQGVIEVSTANALYKVADNPKWCDLSDQYFVLFGASSAMGPYPILMDHGANVIALDLWLPGTEKRPDGFAAVWEKLFEKARNSSGRLIFPVRGSVKKDATDKELAKVAGCNLITEAPEIRTWLSTLLPKERLILFALAYLDGALFMKVSMAMDAIIKDLLVSRSVRPALAYLCTPTDCHVVTPGSVLQAEANSKKQTTLQSIVAGILAACGPAWVLRKNVEKPIVDKEGKTLPLHIVDCIIPQQGPNYILAKRLQTWRSILARDGGSLVSMNVAPSTATASVLSNVSFALSYKGMHNHQPMEITYPATSNTVMAACLISDLRDPTSAANPEVPLDNPLCLSADKAFHGGAWRAGFKLAQLGPSALFTYIAHAFIMTPYLFLYSLMQTIGWTQCMVGVWTSFFQEGALWDSVGPQVTYWQNLACLEIVHAALNLTPSSPVMTAIQVYSRVALVGVLNEFPETFSSNPWPIRAMLVAWTLAEVTRYVYYCFAKFGEIQYSWKGAKIAMKKMRGDELGEPKDSFKIPFPIVWLRYSLFLVLYPLGVSGEIGCLFHALKDIQAMGAAKQSSVIGAFCLDYTLRLQNLTPWVACTLILLFYAWILPGLYNMMRAARAKVLGRGAAKKAPVSAEKKNN